jgi:tRNA pseudouridine55 synthase
MRRRGDRLDGFLVLDKPVGPSSTQAMARARRALGAAKAGHCGTLDPLASGVLVIAFGEATKLVDHVMDGAKTYGFAIGWGEERDTEDAEGKVTATSAVRPDRAAIEAVLPRFLGEIGQIPPRFSAIKLAGRPAYALARGGEDFVPPPRIVRIDRLVLTAIPDADTACFEVECGKGTYVRSLGRDIARALGTCGHLRALRRLRVGGFAAAAAISLETLEAPGYDPRVHLLPVETALDDIPALAVTGAEADAIRHGRAVQLPRAALQLSALPPGRVVAVLEAGTLVALARIEDGQARPLRVFNRNT